MADIHIGLSGYSYKPWQGAHRFYPEALKQADFLHYYAGRYQVVELDGIWYRLPSEQAVRSWIEQTPANFLFAPKAHRSITHSYRLKPDALRFVQQMIDRLAPLRERQRLGPILLQLPPNFRRDDNRLKTFLGQLPGNLRWAIEFRHASWNAPEIETQLRRHDVAWASVETDETPAERRTTANFCYVRLRRTDYGGRELSAWAKWLNQQAAGGRDCFVFFKHEDEGSPWIWADRLRRLTES